MSTSAETLDTSTTQMKVLNKEKIIAIFGLGTIILLGAFLRFYELGVYTIGNTYYAAAVKSMLTSWHNFFFVSFEPGGSVTVDKPPLGFWVQAVSAYFLGVNGFALALPQALAGTLSIPVLYHLVRRHFGVWAGLTAALVLAITPVAIATERNNTIDGLLVFVLLLAAWAFIKATESGRLRFLLLGAFLIGLGFNIKMLQAIMPLPAFYAIYFLGARHPWWKRLLQLAIATGVLLVVSLAWVVTVDLIPTDQRPFIGSSENNTVMELIVGHNGLSRLGLNQRGPGGDGDRPRANSPQDDPAPQSGNPNQNPQGMPPNQGKQQPGNRPANNRPPQEALEACEGLSESEACTVQLRDRKTIQGTCQTIPQGELVCVPPDRNPQAQSPNPLTPNSQSPNSQTPNSQPPNQAPPDGPNNRPGNRRSGETGTAGVLRLFEEPLVTEVSWLLPLVLLAIPVILTALGWTWPLEGQHVSLLLWAGWLLPAMAYFSFTTGLFHRYYLIMLGPSIAALVGMTLWAVMTHWKRNHWLGWAVLAFISGLTILFEMYTFREAADISGIILLITLGSWLVGIGLCAVRSIRQIQIVGAIFVMVALLAVPFTWSALTTFNTHPDVALPTAGSDGMSRTTFMTPNRELLGPQGEAILAYVEANTDPKDYLLATNTARGAAPFILETGRKVFTFGGFSGQDEVIDLDGLSAMLESGELRFVLGLPQQKQEISRWIRTNCSVVDLPEVETTPTTPQPGGPNGEPNEVLFDCGAVNQD